MTIRSIIQLLLYFLLIGPPCLKASVIQDQDIGQLMGVSMTEAEQNELTASQLNMFEDLGLAIIEIEGYAPERILNLIRQSDLSLFVKQNRTFDTVYQLQERDSLYFHEDLSLIGFYEDELGSRAAAFGLFTYPDDKSPSGARLLDRYAERLFSTGAENSDLSLYYRSAYPDPGLYPSSFSFRSVRLAALTAPTLPSQVIHFTAYDSDAESLEDLENLLRISLEAEQSIILLPYGWMVEQMDRFELFQEVIKQYTGSGRVLFPQPAPPEEKLSANWTVLVLLLLLGTCLGHHQVSSFYRSSLFRYFTGHRFFTENLIEYRTRSFLSGAVLFFQHLVIAGLALYIFAESSISPLGTESLYANFPVIGVFGKGNTAFFFLGITIAFILQSASVLWIQVLNSKTRLGQTMTLYGWPLQLNLLVIIFMVAGYQAGPSADIAGLHIVLFLIVWFLGFNAAALDIARYVKKYRVLYIIATVGVPVLFAVLLVAAALFYPPLSEPLAMALDLP